MADTRRLPKPHTAAWDWQLRAACRQMDSGLFFHPDGERGNDRAQRETRAKAFCQSCPVVTSCRTHAIDAREPYGIWGGMSRNDRDRVAATPQDRAS
jgi:WhiB family redox-sensing transcriptional regulator